MNTQVIRLMVAVGWLGVAGEASAQQARQPDDPGLPLRMQAIDLANQGRPCEAERILRSGPQDPRTQVLYQEVLYLCRQLQAQSQGAPRSAPPSASGSPVVGQRAAGAAMGAGELAMERTQSVPERIDQEAAARIQGEAVKVDAQAQRQVDSFIKRLFDWIFGGGKRK